MSSGASLTTVHKWRLIDAKGQVVGRLATDLVRRLLGKDKPTFSPHLDHGDNIILINANHVKFTGNKYNDKRYYWHTNWAGGLRFRTPRQAIERDKMPEFIIQRAVLGMLPKNRLRDVRMKRLMIYPESEYPPIPGVVAEPPPTDPRRFAPVHYPKGAKKPLPVVTDPEEVKLLTGLHAFLKSNLPADKLAQAMSELPLLPGAKQPVSSPVKKVDMGAGDKTPAKR